MNIRKTIILACASAAMCITTATAQDVADAGRMSQRQERRVLPPSPEKQAALLTHRMDSLLDLTEKQYKKLYKLNLKQAERQMESMNGDSPSRLGGAARPGEGAPGHRGMGGRPPMGGGQPPRQGFVPQDADTDNREEQREKARKQREKTEKKIRKILTDEQYTKWQEVRESIAKCDIMGRPNGRHEPDRKTIE